MTRNGSDYVTAAEIPPGYLARYEVTLSALYGAISVSEAARRLDLSRLRFQTLMHRAQRAFAEALLPRPAGRPAKPAREQELETLLAERDREIKALREQLRIAQNLFGTVGDMMRRLRPGRRSGRRPRNAVESSVAPEDPVPTGTPSPSSRPRWRRFTPWMTQMMSELRRLELEVGVRHPRARSKALSPDAERALEHRVRETNGLIGADALRRAANGVSRRQAANLKHRVVRAMERERRAACTAVHVVRPGVLRGFDAMYVATTEGTRFVLVCGDGHVPYRTTIGVAERYDGATVAALLRKDIADHGAPLVYRFDRAKCHRIDAVQAIFDHHGVLVLQGPPRYPWYYGQLERQNREHRAWLDALGIVTPAELEDAVRRMQNALNALWPRRTLGWETPEARWMRRPLIGEDRDDLKRAVFTRVEALRTARRPSDRKRLAIEQVLQERGHLETQPGGWR